MHAVWSDLWKAVKAGQQEAVKVDSCQHLAAVALAGAAGVALQVAGGEGIRRLARAAALAEPLLLCDGSILRTRENEQTSD